MQYTLLMKNNTVYVFDDTIYIQNSDGNIKFLKGIKRMVH